MPKSIDEIYDDHKAKAERGEIDYLQYRESCPFRSRSCASVACEQCRWFIPKPERGGINGRCQHCDSERVSLERYWRAKVQIPSADGLHESWETTEDIYARWICNECMLITDVKSSLGEIGQDEVEPLHTMAYAAQVRELHDDLIQRIEGLEALVFRVDRFCQFIVARLNGADITNINEDD